MVLKRKFNVRLIHIGVSKVEVCYISLKGSGVVNPPCPERDNVQDNTAKKHVGRSLSEQVTRGFEQCSAAT